MQDIKLLVLDVDGTLTDGTIIMNTAGEESKCFNVKDGMGISLAISAGIKVAIITGRKSSIVDIRAAELNIPYVYQGISNKSIILNELLMQERVHLDQTAYVGDDINDLECLNKVGMACCPFDATDEVKQICDYVSSYSGGKGAVRDVIEHILRKQGVWDKVVNDRYGFRNQ